MVKQPENRKWQLLSSEYLHREPWLTVAHNAYRLPYGRVAPGYYILEYPDWVNVIARTAEGLFLLISQYRPGLDATCFELVAGVCDRDDTAPLASAQRELLEETGFGGGSWRELMSISANASTTNNLTHCFVAEGVHRIADHQDLDATEDIQVHLLTVDEVRELLCSNAIKQATHLAPLWRYFAENSLL